MKSFFFIRSYQSISSLVLFFLVLISPVVGEETSLTDVETTLQQFGERKQQCIDSAASLIESATIEGSLAHLFQQAAVDQANAGMRQFSGKQFTLVHALSVMRLLNAFHTQPDILYDETQKHLETEMGVFISLRGEALLLPQAKKTVSESRQLLETAIVVLWSNYLIRTESTYEWPTKKKTQALNSIHESDLNLWLHHRALFGFSDRSSPYYRYMIAALSVIREGFDDERMVTRCDGLLDIMIADMAQQSLGGSEGGARCRTLESLTSIPGDQLPYMLFGNPLSSDQNTHDKKVNLQSLLFALSSYQPPAVLLRFGMDNTNRETYTIKNLFSSHWKIPDTTPTERQYAFVTPNFILGSFQHRNQQVPWQSRPWELTVKDDNHQVHRLFAFAGDQLFSGGLPPYQKEHFRWNTTTLQHKTLLFCRFHRNDRKRASSNTQHHDIVDERHERLPMRLWIPNTFAELTSEKGWWFCRIETTFVAFRPIHGESYFWRHATFQQDDNQGASILAFQDLNTGLILEVEDTSTFSTFEQFKSQVTSSLVDVQRHRVTIVSRGGDVCQFPLNDGPFTINGKIVDAWNDPEYNLFSSPLASSDYGTGRYSFTYQDFSLTLDLNDPNNPVREMTPIQ